MRCIVFDDETAEVMMGRYKRGATEIHYGEQPLNAALKAGRSLLVLPARDPDKVLLARIEVRTGKTPPRSQGVVAQFTPLRTVSGQRSASPDSSARRKK